MLHYTGFRIEHLGREYQFTLSGGTAPVRWFTVHIGAAAFRTGGLKYQDGPELCYGKLQVLLAAEQENGPVADSQQVTASDIAIYQSTGRAKGRTWTEDQRHAARLRAKANRFPS
jgi:hypothetical protein